MNKKALIGIAVVVVFFAIMFIADSSKEIVKVSHIVGEWEYSKTQMMGGREMSMFVTLEITKNGSGKEWSDYHYEVNSVFVDQMYGGTPSTKNSTGDFSPVKGGNKLNFSGGDYGERGGYIVVPEDNWVDYFPETLIVKFGTSASGLSRGHDLIFKKKSK